MKNLKKSNYFLKKYVNTKQFNFYIFTYFPISKADSNLVLIRSLRCNNTQRIILPSSFKLIKIIQVQGPRLGIIYSFNLNFKKLQSLYNLKAITFKYKQNWYSYNLLNTLKNYKNSLNLCTCLNNTLNKHIIVFFTRFSKRL